MFEIPAICMLAVYKCVCVTFRAYFSLKLLYSLAQCIIERSQAVVVGNLCRL